MLTRRVSQASIGLDQVDNTSDATKNSAAVTLTNKTISGASNTLSDIALSSLTTTGTASSSTYLRGDGQWTSIAAGGDASTNTASSVDSEVALFSGTGGKTLKRATGSGVAVLTSGVLSTVTAPSGTIVGTSDSQTLTNKTLTTPKIASAGYIADANGNEQIIFTTTASAVNEITIANAATAGKPTIAASGGDTNVTLNIASKGTGTVQANGVDVVTTSGTQTLTNKTLSAPVLSGNVTGTYMLSSPMIGTVLDSNGNSVWAFVPVTSAVNFLGTTNAASGGTPILWADGSNSNIPIMLQPKGSGQVYINVATGQTPTIEASGADTNHNLNLKSKGAGTVQANGVDIATTTDTQTLTNKDLTSGTNTFPTFNQNTTGSAATLTTGRTIQTNLASTSSATFNGSTNITPGVTGTLPVGNGGTGATTLTGVVIGNGTSAFTTVTAPSGAIVGTTDTQTLSGKTLTTPTIASFTNATHNHQNATGGGQLQASTALNATGTANSSTYLRGDNTWASITAGDASTNTASSVDSEVALFSGTGGKTLKRATGSGVAVLTSGVLSTVTAPSGTIVGTSDSQTLTSKTLTNPTVNNYTEGVVSIGTVTTSSTLDLTNGTLQTATLTASTACTFTMPTATAGKSFVLLLKQAASTGNGTATFTSVKWNNAGTPTVTATAGKMDIFSFFADGTNWYGTYTQGYTP